MNIHSWIPILILGSSFVPSLVIFFLRENQHLTRSGLNLAGALLKLALIGIVYVGYLEGTTYETRLSFSMNWDLVLRVDDLSLLFMSLSAVLWLLTTLYAIGYLEGSPNRSRFFGFFGFCVTTTMGISLAGNLFTFIVFYEMLTLTTYPLIVHRGTAKSIRAGNTYLVFTLAGGKLLLVAAVWIHALLGPMDFQRGGVIEGLATAPSSSTLTLIFVLLVTGLGVKTALVPLHGWLPQAMVAPAPVSALLHAVAVVKAGAYGIVRVVYDVFGVNLVSDLELLTPLALGASLTIIYGSVVALFQTDLKKRLAYSTVSQVSYILLGLGIFGWAGTVGGLVHLVHQGLMKITLFFCAGNFAEVLGVRNIKDMNGIGRRMPLTMGCFTLAAFGMIGLPPLAGFISKWYLGLGAAQNGQYWILGVLAMSSLLNAAYFLPIIYAGWFKTAPSSETETKTRRSLEGPWLLLVPPLATALLSLATGVFAGLYDLSPLGAAQRIAERVYDP